MVPIIPLHTTLEPYRQEIEATLKPCVRITATPAKTSLWQSKLGGLPYIPLDNSIEHLSVQSSKHKEFFPYPRNRETGEELYMLAQLNFEEIPHITSFPEKGILQIFIDIRERYMGMNPDNKTDQTTFRIIYYPDINRHETMLWTDFSKVDKIGPNGTAVECELQFEKTFEPISQSDHQFGKIYSKELNQEMYRINPNTGKREVLQSYQSLLAGEGGNKNKMGGYHYSQNNQDPRYKWLGGNSFSPYFENEESILLIQFDGCDVFSWGDGGTACFFIKKQDLENLDFSNVIYHWDCT